MSLIQRLRRDDAGFTLVEILVVIVLLLVVGAVVSTTSIFAMKATKAHQQRTYATEDVQAQIERLGRDIRVADPIRAASAMSMTLDLYRGNTCVREQWTLSGTKLMVTQTTYASWSACSNYPATATPTSTVTRTALSSLGNGATSLFTYEDASGTAMGTPSIPQIAVVHVNVIESVTGRTGKVTFTTSVGVRNESLA